MAAGDLKTSEIKLIEALPKFLQSAVWQPSEGIQIPFVSQIFLQNDDHNWHINDCCIFTYCLRGRKDCIIADRKVTLNAGEAVIMPANIRHKFCVSSADTLVLLFCFYFNFKKNISQKIAEECFVPSAEERKILFSAVKSFSDSKNNLESSMYFAIALNRLTDRFLSEPEKTESHGYDCPKIHQASMIIQENLHRKLTLAELAKALNISVSSLQKMFYSKMRCSVGKYILNQRLSKASKLLRSTGMSLGEIALVTGFESDTTLRRALKRETGYSPSRIREIARGIIAPGIQLRSNGFPISSKKS